MSKTFGRLTNDLLTTKTKQPTNGLLTDRLKFDKQETNRERPMTDDKLNTILSANTIIS